MKKFITTTILCGIICCLPLAGKPNLYVSLPFLVVIFFFYLLFFTQPTFETSDIYKNSKTDRFSMGFITLGVIIVISGGLIHWAYFQNSTIFQWHFRTILGLLLLIIGSSIRIWAIRHLGKHFTNSVQFSVGHKLITSGPYRLIRHPSYLGAYMAIIGTPLFLGAMPIFFVGIIVMLCAYLYRIHVEEKGLVLLFKEDYLAYQEGSKKLLPFMF